MVTIDLAKALAGDPLNNVVLRPRDRLIVHTRDEVQDQIVRVEGEVNTPRAIAFYQGMKASDAIFAAGGLKAECGSR